MARYELADGDKTRWFEVDLDGTTCVSRWGVVGVPSVKRSAKRCASVEEAQKARDKVVRDKEKAGWLLAGAASAARPSGAGSDDAALRAAILADPGNVAAYLVYADHLQTHGDPRGDLIALHHKLGDAKGAEKAKLGKAAAKLLADPAADLLPIAIADQMERLKLEWRLGFLREIRYHWHDEGDEDVDEIVIEALLKHPSARFLEELHVGIIEGDGDLDYGRIARIVAKHTPPALRRLSFDVEDWQISWSAMDISSLSGKLPRLEWLHVRGGSPDLGKAIWPSLRELTVETGGLGGNEEAVGKASYPHLQKLHLSFGRAQYGGSEDASGCRGLLAGKGLPTLKHLGLTNAEFADELCDLLPRAKILPQLATLDLSQGNMTTAGLARLIAGAGRFAHLESLDLSENCIELDASLEKAARKLCKKVTFAGQKDPEDERYASVGE